MSNKQRNKYKTMGEHRRQLETERRIRRELELERMASRPPWTPFERVTAMMNRATQQKVSLAKSLILSYGDRAERAEVYQNSRYMVYKVLFVLTYADGSTKHGYELSIRNQSRSAEFDWRDMQRIKNELCGPEMEACELFPAESRLVDTANQRYVFVLPEGDRFPFGFEDRLVAEDFPEISGAVQRPFEPDSRPADLVSSLRDLHIPTNGEPR